MCVDVVAVREIAADPVPIAFEAVPPLPRPACPPDHIPLVADSKSASGVTPRDK